MRGADLLGEIDRLTDGNLIARPKVSRDRNGRWHRDTGAEWDWFYALPQSERSYLQAHYMTERGVQPDVVATWLDASVDTAMGEWVFAIRTARQSRPRSADPLEWDEPDPENDYSDLPELMGVKGIAELFGVSLSTPRVWRARGKLPPPTILIDGEHAAWDRETIGWWIEEIRTL